MTQTKQSNQTFTPLYLAIFWQGKEEISLNCPLKKPPII